MTFFDICPKIDSKSQRRVQCSINIKGISNLKSYHEEIGGKCFGFDYAKSINSLSRSRNTQSIENLKQICRDNQINGYSRKNKTQLIQLLTLNNLQHLIS